MKGKTVEVWTEFGKPAQSVILTANRKGMSLNPWDWSDVYEVPFATAFTQREIRGELQDFRHNNHLSMAKLKSATIIELDSTNMSHAGAYYKAIVEVLESEAKLAELI